MLCLGALLAGASAIRELSRSDTEERDQAVQSLQLIDEWVQNERLTGHQSRQERDFFEREPSSVTDHELIQASWRSESAGVLAWALSAVEPFGKAYRNLTPDEYTEATSIAMERHFALNWPCGYSRDWDKTPTDT